MAAARAVGYVGVGTVEYLVDASGFYFLEMNTRLQVEHGVTELVTGLDLVGLQLLVAGGSPLPFGQSDVTVPGPRGRGPPRAPSGPATATGRRRVAWRMSDGRAAMACASIAPSRAGSVVSAAYDSLVAKLMAHGPDRPGAVARLSRALRALELDGLETNRDLLGAVLDDDVFRRGEADIHFLDDPPRSSRRSACPTRCGTDTPRRRRSVCLAARAGRSLVPVPAAGWRNVGRPLHADELTDGTGTLEVRAESFDRAGAGLGRRCMARRGDGGPVASETGEAADPSAARDRRCRRPGWSISPQRTVCAGATGSVSRPTAPRSTAPKASRASCCAARTTSTSGAASPGSAVRHCPGVIGKVLVATGEQVAEGDGLVVLEAMKMEHTLRANGAGTVAAVHCAPGQQVDVNDLLVTVEPS